MAFYVEVDFRDWPDRHPRHVPGRAARGRPTIGGRRAAIRRIGPLQCRSVAEAKLNRQAAGHLRVADKMRQRVDGALAPDTRAARTEAGGAARGVTGGQLMEPEGRARINNAGTTWRGACRPLLK